MDKKILNDINAFSPFGRGGGGAPLKDKEGNPIGDLSKLKSEAKELNNLPIEIQRQVKMQQLENETKHKGDVTQRRSNNENDSPSYARGGNGIFGEAKTDVQKKNEEKYKAELKKQVIEKK
jgi:ribose 5-phosphate isomerase